MLPRNSQNLGTQVIETDETTKILDSIGNRHFYMFDQISWWIASPAGKGSVAVFKRGDKWSYWGGHAHKSGFKMLEALADSFPFVAAKLAEPMK